ncbi:MAG TPA: glycoside hydrolase family 16 protein [Solirubrobacteraceae bacterium]|nr:glycoside hydrolase family 16 protein [Solirubrobacteraceae bacterium]
MAGHSILRRWRARVVVLSVLALAGAGATAASANAQQPAAHTASRTATLIIHPASIGKYEVIVWVRSRGKHSRVVDIYLTGRPMQSVRADPWWGARVYYTLKLTGSELTIRTVNDAPAVQVRASLILKGVISKPKATTTTTSNGNTTTTTTTTTTPPPTPTPTPTPPSTPPPPPPNPPYSSTYTKILWDEEFTGAAGTAPDSNWVYDTGPSCGTSDCSVDTASLANAALDGNGDLAITALRSGNGTYTTAQVETLPSVTFHVGEELDARIKLPAGQGLWGGFWLYQSTTAGGSVCSPSNCGELDVLEAPEFGASPTADYFDLHGPLGGTNQQQWQSYEQSLGDLSTGFHVYGVTWAPGLITWTIDGTPFASAAPSSLSPGSTWEFDQGNYRLLLDLATGGWPPAASTASATMLVDWVRVYTSS